jgi:hypothetical protein
MSLSNDELYFRKWGTLCVGGFIREFRKKQIIRIEEGEIFIGSSIGKASAQLEPVTSVYCDQIEYHLYSKKYEISIRIKRLPADFRELFNEKREAEPE